MSTYPGYGTFTPAHAQSAISQSNAVVKPLSNAELNKQRMSLATAGNKVSQKEIAQVRNDSRFNAGLENFRMPSSWAPTAAQQALSPPPKSSPGKKTASASGSSSPSTAVKPAVHVPSVPSGSVNYQTGISVGNAADPNRIRELVNTNQQVDAGSASGNRAVDDYTKSMNMNNQAQMDMAVQGANSQQLMNSQQKRSESSISGLNDQAAIYADAADRFRQALGLQTSVDAAEMSYDYGIQANNIRRLKNIARGNP